MFKKIMNKAVPKMYGFYFDALYLFSKERAANFALEVFSTPRRGGIQEFQKEFLATARSQRIITDQGTTQLYHWEGNGKTIMMFHGWESNSWRWKYLIDPLLEKGYNIIAIDAPAHGASSGKQFTAVLYSKVINHLINMYQPDIVISHSVGAMATIYQESNDPHPFIEKFVLLGGPDRLDIIMRNYQKMVGFSNKVYRSLDDLLFKLHGFRIDKFNSAQFAKNIKAQVLMIHSDQDSIVAFDSMESIASNLERVQTYNSKTGGHSLHTTEVVDRILEFL